MQTVSRAIGGRKGWFWSLETAISRRGAQLSRHVPAAGVSGTCGATQGGRYVESFSHKGAKQIGDEHVQRSRERL